MQITKQQNNKPTNNKTTTKLKLSSCAETKTTKPQSRNSTNGGLGRESAANN
jgi:hypothetical protein